MKKTPSVEPFIMSKIGHAKRYLFKEGNDIPPLRAKEMGNKKFYITLGIILLLLPVVISGCTQQNTDQQKKDERTIIGTWQDQDTSYRTYTFYENGTCIINAKIRGTYNLTNKSLIISFAGDKNTFEYWLSGDGKTIQLTNTVDGYIRMYRKQ